MLPEISRRELLIGLAIFVGLSLIAIALTGYFREIGERRYITFSQALKTNEPDKFAYGVQTNVGNILAHGDVVATEPQSMPEIKGEWAIVGRTEEHYNQHTRQVSYSCGTAKSPQTCYRTEVYYSWDYENDTFKRSPLYTVLGVPTSNLCAPGTNTANLDDVYQGSDRHDGTYAYPNPSIFGNGDVRYYWEVSPVTHNGTVFVRAFDGRKENPLDPNSCIKFWNGWNIDQVMEDAEPNNAVAPILLTGFVLLAVGGWFAFAYSNDY